MDKDKTFHGHTIATLTLGCDQNKGLQGCGPREEARELHLMLPGM
jgi:hypothetical protein